MPDFNLPYGGSYLPVTIPDDWLGEIVAPVPVQPAADPPEVIAQALANPIGAPRLEQLARPGQKATILIDDYTRKTPTHLLLPPLLEKLEWVGIKKQDITLIIALGSHRPMNRTELHTKLGKTILGTYRVINAPADNDANLTCLGLSPSGISVHVLPDLAEADLRIGLGMITPHMDAGFSGGTKIILPGACSLQTVDAFHALAISQPENQLGNPDAPLRLELEHFISSQMPLHFILNLVLTPDNLVYECVAGEPVSAHRVGVGYARNAYGAAVRRRYPLVVANCYPYQQDLWQSMKGLWCGELLTQDGGTLVLVTHASEGHSNYPLLPRYIGQNPTALLAELQNGGAADPKSAVTGLLVGWMKQRIRLALVSQGLSREDARMMEFDWYPHLESALEYEICHLPSDQRHGCIALIPRAGVTLPLLPAANTS
ncbi:MAG TPA: nickel-dependent lactate racemase [Anaerolineales bacterium]|nr:nickel-dependent lactate racemase [Anaerolineales bacterium]